MSFCISLLEILRKIELIIELLRYTIQHIPHPFEQVIGIIEQISAPTTNHYQLPTKTHKSYMMCDTI